MELTTLAPTIVTTPRDWTVSVSIYGESHTSCGKWVDLKWIAGAFYLRPNLVLRPFVCSRGASSLAASGGRLQSFGDWQGAVQAQGRTTLACRSLPGVKRTRGRSVILGNSPALPVKALRACRRNAPQAQPPLWSRQAQKYRR